jgi:hypothetical protein
MIALYNSPAELNAKIEAYFKANQELTPRSFRIYLGLSKQMINKYKKEQPAMYELVHNAEDFILAQLEQKLIYNPDLSKSQRTGIIFILRAYDRFQYIPELINHNIAAIEDKKAIINIDFKQPTKKGGR